MAGEVAGDADCLVFPNIDAGNVFYKTSTKLAGCEVAAMVAGAQAPVHPVLPGRQRADQAVLHRPGGARGQVGPFAGYRSTPGVDLGHFLARQHPQGALGQGEHLVLAGVDGDAAAHRGHRALG